jgi:MFS transporter, DHA2 family, multidrug resistance protein
VAVMATLLARRGQEHQSAIVSHLHVGDPETVERLRMWTSHFTAQGSDSFTAQKRAIGALYHEVTQQAQLLAVADVFWVLFMLFSTSVVLLPLLRRVRMGPVRGTESREEPAHAALPVE